MILKSAEVFFRCVGVNTRIVCVVCMQSVGACFVYRAWCGQVILVFVLCVRCRCWYTIRFCVFVFVCVWVCVRQRQWLWSGTNWCVLCDATRWDIHGAAKGGRARFLTTTAAAAVARRRCGALLIFIACTFRPFRRWCRRWSSSSSCRWWKVRLSRRSVSRLCELSELVFRAVRYSRGVTRYYSSFVANEQSILW